MHHTIEVRDLHYSYPDGRAALQGVSCHIGPGEKVALVGPNGAGKSTLMLQLNGVLRPERGAVLCGGLAVVKRNLKRVRQAVGLVFQDPDDQLFSLNVFDDVAYGPTYMGVPEQEIEARVEAALAAVSLPGFKNRVSHHLSIGEKKRVAIATVLAMDPEILALDEPSHALDPRGRRELIELLRRLPQTMLVATHDLRLAAEICSRTLVMESGRIVAEGSSQNILSDAELLRRHGLESPWREIEPLWEHAGA